MEENIEGCVPVDLTVKNVFSGVRYVIPIYQRNYAWQEAQIEQLLNDIIDVDNGCYYLGNLIVDHKGENVYEVIDGQQRLTTLYLLHLYLKFDVGEKALFFEAREKANYTLNYLKNNSQWKQNDYFVEEILSGYGCIVKFFKSNSALKEKLRDNLDKVHLVRVAVPRGIDLNHYFEIMNTRGEQLEQHEILKARLLSSLEERDREKAALIWDACSNMDSYVQMNFLDTGLRKRIFSNRWNKLNVNSFDEIDLSGKGSDRYYSINEILSNDGIACKKEATEDIDTENQRFSSIITFPQFLLQINEAIGDGAENGLDDKRFLDKFKWVNNADGNKAKSFIFDMLKCRYLFDKHIVKREFAKSYKDEGRWSLQKLKKYKYEKKESPQYVLTYKDESYARRLRMLESCLRITYTSPKTMHWIALALRALRENENVDLVILLEKYCAQKVCESNYKNKKGFEIERIVFSYLDYLLANHEEYASRVPRDWQFQFRNSVEHFHPQHPDNGVIWDNDSLNSFGNLALITVSANSRFSNAVPIAKCEYEDNIKQSVKLMIMSEIAKKNGWNVEEMQTHEREMIDVLDKNVSERIMDMYKIGVSTPKAIDEEMFKLYNKAGISQMEVSVNKELSEALDYEKLLEWSKKYGVELYSFHLPFWPFNEIDISSPDMAEKSVEYLKGYIDNGTKIGIYKYIIHPSGEPIDESDRENRMKIAKQSLSVLAEYASERGAVVCVENLPRTCLGRDSKDILELLDANDKLVACFDTNHLLDEDPIEFIKAIGKRIVTLHVSDYDFKNERHWLPGEGMLDWNSIIKALFEIEYSGSWLYEINLDAPWTIKRPRDLTYHDFYRNAVELFTGKELTKISTPVKGLKKWNE